MKNFTLLFAFMLITAVSFGQLENTYWSLNGDSPTSLAVGNEGQGSSNWWAIGEGGDVARPCIYDDTIAFHTDGTFENIMSGETWVETWQDGATEGCRTPVAPHDGSGDYQWFGDATTVTVTGLGAHIGLAKVHNGGELESPDGAVTEIEYLFEIVDDTLLLVDIEYAAGQWWRFEYKFMGNIQATGVDEISVFDAKMVFPNVASSEITVNVNAAEYTIINSLGQVVKVANTPVIKISDLANGVYFIQANEKVSRFLVRK
jgi:hypothetical protein